LTFWSRPDLAAVSPAPPNPHTTLEPHY
jgi:hypothetical protein